MSSASTATVERPAGLQRREGGKQPASTNEEAVLEAGTDRRPELGSAEVEVVADQT